MPRRPSQNRSRQQPTAQSARTVAASRRGSPRRTAAVVSLALAALVLAVFGRTVTYGFVSYDDPDYVTENPMVQRGVDLVSLDWALTSFDASNWHPLTWVSHLVDWQLWGADAGGHHLTNVLLHMLAVVLLFWALRRMTRRLWPSALVAALFAVHPLRVESVAWVAERKDVLSGMLAMAVLLAWAWYAERPHLRRYGVVVLLLVLGLAAKPMLVTLPLVLLLLDLWPLGRVDPAELVQLRTNPAARRKLAWLGLEKLPLLAIAGASSVLTLLAQRTALGGFVDLSLTARIGNALVSYVAYLGKSLWPSCLAVFYPHPAGGLPAWQPIAAGALLVAITVSAIAQLPRRPWLAVGWFWYVGTLVPVVGVVQVGSQAMADRYTYLPQVGLWIVIAFALAEFVERRPPLRTAVIGGATAAVLAAAVLASLQVRYWQSSEALFRHALAYTTRNWVADTNLAEVLIDQGHYTEALQHAEAAITANPAGPAARVLLGNALLKLARPQDAVTAYRGALKQRPDHVAALYNLGVALTITGDPQGAEASYREALALDPSHDSARINLGVLLLQRRDAAAAADVLCAPEAAASRVQLLAFNCGLALAALGRDREAVSRLEHAVALDPGFLSSQRALGLLLERLGRRPQAITVLEQARRLAPDDAIVNQALARLRQPLGATPAGPTNDVASRTAPR